MINCLIITWILKWWFLLRLILRQYDILLYLQLLYTWQCKSSDFLRFASINVVIHVLLFWQINEAPSKKSPFKFQVCASSTFWKFYKILQLTYLFVLEYSLTIFVFRNKKITVNAIGLFLAESSDAAKRAWFYCRIVLQDN